MKPTLPSRPLILISLLTLLVTGSLNTPAQTRKRRQASKRQTHAAPKPQVRLADGARVATLPFELVANLVLAPVRVNNSAPLWFIFDTGAESTVIDTKQAQALGLRARGKTTGTGTAGTAEAGIVRNASLTLPGVEARGLTVYTLPLDFLWPALGRQISGVLGNDVFNKFVFEIDYANRVISLYEPESYSYAGPGKGLPVLLEDNQLYLRTSITPEGRAPVEGKLQLDTGSTGSLTLYTKFVNRHRLLETLSQSGKINIGGVGGAGAAVVGRVKSLRLGDAVIERPVTRFSRATRGDAGGTAYDGLVGGEIFRRFKVIFDYPGRRVVFEPNADFGAPHETDMSGIELVGDGDDFSVYLIDDVDAGSAAERAGVKGGDVLLAIDGRPARALTLDEIRRLFMQDGREYALTLKRGDQTVKATLKLKRLI